MPVIKLLLPPKLSLFIAASVAALFATIGVLSVNGGLREAWSLRESSREVMIELTSSEAMTRETQVRVAEQRFTQAPSVAGVQVLDDDTVRTLLLPWLGAVRGEDLPAGRLLRVTLRMNVDPTSALAELGKIVSDLPGAVLADYYRSELPEKRARADFMLRNSAVTAVLWLGFFLTIPPLLLQRLLRRQTAARGAYLYSGGDRLALTSAVRTVFIRSWGGGMLFGSLPVLLIKQMSGDPAAADLLLCLPFLWAVMIMQAAVALRKL